MRTTSQVPAIETTDIAEPTDQPAPRRCIGSARYGIEAHEAPVEEFLVQPSQRDGLGRMCKVHWNQYTAGLARDAKARKAAATGTVEAPPEEPRVTAMQSSKAKPVAGAPLTDEQRRAAADDMAAALAATQARSARGRRRVASPEAVRRATPDRDPSGRTTGPGRTSGAALCPVASLAGVPAIARRGRPVAPMGQRRGVGLSYRGAVGCSGVESAARGQ